MTKVAAMFPPHSGQSDTNLVIFYFFPRRRVGNAAGRVAAFAVASAGRGALNRAVEMNTAPGCCGSAATLCRAVLLALLGLRLHWRTVGRKTGDG